ncbi:hypothetical protein SAMN05660473_01305 [Arthrobacter sp. 49Tsu3.1M3]|nr:hypothetical protein SAMN05660473_01305 [Arthrobacter sp. 49Tsu3.1M3]
MRSDFGDRGYPTADDPRFHDGAPRGGVRRSASGRIPQWAVDEALGKLEDPAPWREIPGAGGKIPKIVRPRRKRPRRARQWGKSGTFVALALIVGLNFVPPLFEQFVMAPLRPYLPGATAPPPGVDAANSPLGSPPVSSGSHAYALHPAPDGIQGFAAYDPCRPVHYVVRPDNGPPGAERLISEAVDEVSAATGLHFAADGVTSEAPTEQRKTYQPDRYGRRWAPVLIAWSSPEEVPQLAGNVAGRGGSTAVSVSGRRAALVSGQVALDAPDLARIMLRPDGPAYVRAVILHELGHVVGLDHVDDPTQLMHAENSGLTGFAAGDLAGLALLGSGPCVPEL